MFLAPSDRIPEPEPESILIYGTGETPMSMFAAALAQRVQPRFAWVNCADPAFPVDQEVRKLIVRHNYEGRSDRVDPAELHGQTFRSEVLDTLIAPTASRDRLLELLRLPALFQGVIQFPPQDGDRPTLVLARVDALPPELMRDTLADANLHETLHRSRVTLVATFRGNPAPPLQKAFDRIFAVEETPGALWSDAFVWSERGLAELDLLQPLRLRDAWPRLGLDLDLLGK